MLARESADGSERESLSSGVLDGVYVARGTILEGVSKIVREGRGNAGFA